MTHFLELDIIRSIHQFRNSLFDAFFTFLDFFDRQEFLFILIPAVWLGKNSKIGLRLFYLAFTSALINYMLKQLFALPRPFHLDPSVGIIQVHGYGFPSGAAQTAVLISGLLLAFWRSKWRWAVVGAYAFLISFSRVYLGVHFMTDILGGWLIGLSLWAIFAYLSPVIERRLEGRSSLTLLLVSQLIPLSLLLIDHSSTVMRLCCVAMGIGVGTVIGRERGTLLPEATSHGEIARRIVVGVVGTFGSYLLTYKLPLAVQFFTIGLWVSLGAGWLCTQLGRKKYA